MGNPPLVSISSERLSPRRCPVCSAKHDAVTGIGLDGERATVTVGAITMCSTCGTLLVFTVDSYRVGTKDDLDGLDARARHVFGLLQGLPRKQPPRA